MRLLNPSIGECLDRLTILARKCEELQLRGEDTTRFADEALLVANHAFSLTPDRTRPLVIALTLAAVNAMIWERQEQANRLTAEADVVDLTDTARGMHALPILLELTKLNQRRAQLVAELDGLEKSQEKL